MTEFAVIYDPVRNLPFAVVLKSNELCEIKALNGRAQSWANSQFDEIEVPNGMTITEYKPLTKSAKNIIDNYEFIRSDAISEIATKTLVHSYRHENKNNSSKQSSMPIRRFGKSGRSSIIDFKAKKFINTSKKSSINKKLMTNNYVRSKVGSGNIRRLSTSAKSLISYGSNNKRISRRLRDISNPEVKSIPISARINVAILKKYVGFRQL